MIGAVRLIRVVSESSTVVRASQKLANTRLRNDSTANPPHYTAVRLPQPSLTSALPGEVNERVTAHPPARTHTDTREMHCESIAEGFTVTTPASTHDALRCACRLHAVVI